jgi:uncharacterized short protein YbdD (DUF466 family)
MADGRLLPQEATMFDIKSIAFWATRAARLLIGIPDYDTYVDHRRRTRPGEPVMSYEEFFLDRQKARYAFDKGTCRGCG